LAACESNRYQHENARAEESLTGNSCHRKLS
jgi:hypothetical protein